LVVVKRPAGSAEEICPSEISNCTFFEINKSLLFWKIKMKLTIQQFPAVHALLPERIHNYLHMLCSKLNVWNNIYFLFITYIWFCDLGVKGAFSLRSSLLNCWCQISHLRATINLSVNNLLPVWIGEIPELETHWVFSPTCFQIDQSKIRNESFKKVLYF
jgi:hypothetical protein